jgi:metal-responsive CopG/Arc/MetJ family transcriptional regulator
MSTRINIVLPDRTLKVLDRVAGKSGRSRYVSEAVLFYVQTQAFSDLQRRLDQGILAIRLNPAQEFPLKKQARSSRGRRKP